MSLPVKQELRSGSDKTQGSLSQAVTPMSPIQIKISPEVQRNLVDIILDDFLTAKNDRDSRSYGTSSKGEKLTFDTWHKKIKDLYSGERIPKTIPWKFCSNRSLKIAAAILEMLHSRLFSGVWQEDLCRWKPGGIEDVPKVERISKFMDWWVRVWAPMREFFDGWVKVVAGFGDALVELSWEVSEFDDGTTEQQPITDESGQPMFDTMGQPAVQTLPKLKRYEKTVARVIPKENVYFFKNARDVERDPVMIEEEYLYKDLEAMEKVGQCINVTTELKKYIPVNIGTTVSDPDEAERLRAIKLRNQTVKIIRWYGHYDYDGAGFPHSVRCMVAKDFKIYLGGIEMKSISKSGKRPLVFEKYSSYLSEIDALWGEGVLDQVRELSEEVDAIFNQMTDGNTLSLLRPFFFDPSGDLDASAIELAPNKGVPVTDPQRNVYVPPFDINTDRLINAIRMVLEFIERLTAASSYVMGKESEIVGGSGTATRTQAIMQSAEIRFTRPVERLKSAAACILTKTLDLIQLNIPPGMETRVLGEKNQQIFHINELTEEGLSGQFDAYILNDPTMGSKATEREVVTMLYSLLMQNPIVITDPFKIYKLTSDVLKSVGKDPVEYLGPAPNPDDVDEPDQENTLILQGDFNRVRANLAENHFNHIQVHTSMLQSPTFAQLARTAPALSQQVIAYVMNHIMEHQTMMQNMLTLMSKIGGRGGESGSWQGGKGGPSKTSENGGMDNTPGPLGQVMQDKREGQVRSPAQV